MNQKEIFINKNLELLDACIVEISKFQKSEFPDLTLEWKQQPYTIKTHAYAEHDEIDFEVIFNLNTKVLTNNINGVQRETNEQTFNILADSLIKSFEKSYISMLVSKFPEFKKHWIRGPKV